MKKKKQNNKKIYGLIAVIVILVVVLIGVIAYIYPGLVLQAPAGEKKIQSSEEAGKTLSDLGNDLQKVSEDLREMEGVLG